MSQPTPGHEARNPAPTTEEPAFLMRSMRWWNLAFLIIIGIVGVITLLANPGGRDTLIALAALALLAVGHTTYGRRQIQVNKPRWRASTAGYLAALYAVTLLIAYLSDIGSLLFFVAFTSTWMMLPVVWSIAGSVVFTCGIVGLQVANAGWTSSAWTSGLLVGAPTAIAGILLGLWITGIVSESQRRQALIAELEHTRSELGEAQHRAGALAERERLAAEIHDTIAQGLLSIVVHARAIDPDDSDPHPRVRRIEQIAEENLAEARGLIEALQPAELREHSLPDACGRVCDRFGTDTGIETRFRSEGEPRTLPANVEVVLLRATQETLTNVRKHARAGAASVTLSYLDGAVRLRVTDDGVGFVAEGEPGDPFAEGEPDDPAPGHRAGLRGMRTRAEQIHGRIEVNSSPGSGTTILMEVPS